MRFDVHCCLFNRLHAVQCIVLLDAFSSETDCHRSFRQGTTPLHAPPPVPAATRNRFRSLFLKGVPIDDFWRYLGWSLLSGGTSGAVSLAVLYPLDFARTRVGTDVRRSGSRQFHGSVDCLRQTYKIEVRLTFFGGARAGGGTYLLLSFVV